ncbi:MAG: TRAP transporter small permease subunit [Spirochaetales bacterium]|uniref:TRAP transporter small permease subunit n=1 Tax=Candidatus Thalassospirochaeta sargassi TaxID=3119039 RepID=A0AAJ1IDU2_9SPIO|nr:TRAP transporter small permease subunit [Spirochaetales bacterium]
MKTSRSKRSPLVVLSVILLFVLIGMTIVQVVLRTVFNYPLIGTEELARYFLISIVFLSIPLTTRSEEHIKMIEIQKMFPLKIQNAVCFFCDAGSAFVFIILAFSAAMALKNNIGNRTINLGIPSVIFLAPTVIGFIGSAVYSILNLKKAVIKLRPGKAGVEV